MSVCCCRKRTMAEIRDLIKESLLFAQIVYEFDLPADFVRGIHKVDNFLSKKINELERRFDMIGTCKQGRPRYEIHKE